MPIISIAKRDDSFKAYAGSCRLYRVDQLLSSLHYDIEFVEVWGLINLVQGRHIWIADGSFNLLVVAEGWRVAIGVDLQYFGLTTPAFRRISGRLLLSHDLLIVI